MVRKPRRSPLSQAPTQAQLEARLQSLWGEAHWNDTRLHIDPQRVPLERPLRRWVMPASVVAAVAVVALLGVFVLGGLLRGGGGPAPASTVTSTSLASLPPQSDSSAVDPESLVVHDGDTVRVSGEVIATPGKGAVACPPYPDDLMQHSGPPSCSGPGVPVDGLDVAALTPIMTQKGVVVANETIEGVWHGGRIRVTAQAHVDDTKGASFTLGGDPPCATPAGGWKSVAGNLDLTALQHYEASHKNSITGIATWRLADNTGVAFAVSWGDAGAVMKALASAYPDALCVVRSTYTQSQLAAVKADVMGGGIADILTASKAISWGPSYSKLGQRNYEIESVSVSQDLADWAAQQPAGIVSLDPWMRPVPRPPAPAATGTPSPGASTAGAQLVDSLPALPDAASVAPDQLVVHDGGVVRLTAVQVQAHADGSARVCEPDEGDAPHPPGYTPPDPCPGLDVVGLDLGQLADRATSNGITTGVTTVQGVLHGAVLTATMQLVPREVVGSQPAALTPPPCTAPVGGWQPRARNGDTDDADLGAASAYQHAHPGAIVGFTPRPVGDDDHFIMLITTWGDPQPVIDALGADYPNRLCVVRSKYTLKQVTATEDAAENLDGSRYELAGTVSGLTDDQGQRYLGIAVTRVTQALADWVDRQPAGYVHLSPWLRPVGALRYEGTVLDDGHGPQFCTTVLQSSPPQCSGTPVVGWDWSASAITAADTQVAGVHWVENVAFTGTPSPDGTKIVVDPSTEAEAPLG